MDELGLEFGDMFGPPGSGAPEGDWSDSLRKLDEALSAISGPENARLWTADALDGPEWAEVRSLAREAVTRRPH